MRRKSSFKSGRSYRVLICTYFAVMLFALGVGLTASLFFCRETEKVLKKNYEERIRYASEKLDQILEKVGSLAYEIVSDKTVKNYSTITEPLEDLAKEYQKKAIQENMLLYQNLNDDISDIIICFDNSEVALSTQNVYRGENRDIVFKSELGMSYDEVREKAEGIHGRTFCISGGYNSEGEGVCYLIQKGMYTLKKNFFVVFVLNTSSLTDILTYEGGTAMIRSSSGEYLLSGDGGSSDGIFLRILAEAEDSVSVEESGEYVLFRRASEIGSLEYMLLLNKDSYMGAAYRLRSVLTVVFIFTLLAGALMIVVMSRRVYSPVEKLLHTVADAAGPPDRKNEFEYLSREFAKHNAENGRMQALIREQNESLASLLLFRILRENYWPGEELAAGMGLSGNAYYLIIIDIEFLLAGEDAGEEKEIGSDSVRYYSRLEKDEKESIDALVYGKAEEFLNSGGNAVISAVEERIVCLMPAGSTPEETEAGGQETGKKLRELRRSLNRDHGIYCSFIVSDGAAERDKLTEAYGKMVSYIQKKYLIGKSRNEIIYPGEEKQSEAVGLFGIEKDIREKIAARDYEVAYKMLDYYFESILESGEEVPLQTIQLRMYGLTYILIATLGLDSRERGEDTKESETEADVLLSSQSILELRDNVHRIFRELISAQDRSVNGSVAARGDEIVDYVNQHIFSEDLSAGAVCEEFHISNSYLSRIFKQTTGTNLLKYIHTARVERAKKLLTDTDIGINDIAGLLGFSERRTFNRVFTESENMSPSAYRADRRGAEEAGDGL